MESASSQTPGAEETSHIPAGKKGRLKIFFGMSPGVGKTYAMLAAAQARRVEGLDVVAGVVETHGRTETLALLEGIETLPPVRLNYRGGDFTEFDLDGMLERSPQIALVDELAHSNIPGSRHPKRYQDVRELLDHGIDVYTTLNVQHLESRADAVETLAAAQVRERVPDTVLEWADEIELIDLSPEGLRQRLVEGKVYRGEKAATAADAFFSEKNLAALREMALRSTAERVNLDLVRTLKQERETKPLPTGERIMVAVGPSPFSAKLIRWTKRYANSLNASWVAVHVERSEQLDPEARRRLNATLQLARSLGAEIASTSGEDIVESLLRTARRELVTQIVVGRSPASALRRFFTGGSLSDRVIARSGAIAVHVVPGIDRPTPVKWQRLHTPATAGWKEYLWALGCALGLGLLSYPVHAEIGYWTVALLFLALTVLGGFFLSRGPVLALAIILATGWNFFYVPPQFTLQINSGQDILLFVVLLLVATTMGQLTARLRALNQAERRRETRSYALYRFLDCLHRQTDPLVTIEEALAHASEVVGFRVALLIRQTESTARRMVPGSATLSEKESGVASWVMENRDAAGAQTQNLPEITSLFLPVDSGGVSWGALKVELGKDFLPLASRDLLTQMAGLLGRFLERENLRIEAERAQVLDASQRLQKTLLDTVSHELKTPLTIILGALDQVVTTPSANDADTELLRHAQRSAQRLLRNVNMLLDLTRFEGGVVKLRSETVELDDLVHRLKAELFEEFERNIDRITFAIGIEVVSSDDGLLFQLVNQLLRNALGHTTPETSVHCRFERAADGFRVIVSDNGPGLPEDAEALFVAFSHGTRRRAKGLGLGLSIARRICENLGGALTAENRTEGGARFVATLPAAPPPATSAS